jgi:hypothetical protein
MVSPMTSFVDQGRPALAFPRNASNRRWLTVGLTLRDPRGRPTRSLGAQHSLDLQRLQPAWL